MSESSWMRGTARALAIVGLLLAALVLRAVGESRSELSEANRLRQAGHLETALVHYRRAARWYVPGSPFDEAALAALVDIAEAAEHEGATQRALSSYRAIRAAIMATRSFYTPHATLLEAANRRIADLTAVLPPSPMDADKSRPQLRSEHLALLQEFRGPNVGWTWVVLVGFSMWVGGALGFSMRAFDEQTRLIPRQARRWGAWTVVGLGLFVVGVAMA